MRRLPPLLLAAPALGIARLLPEHGFGLWLRLAAATLVLLLPGRLVAQGLAVRGVAASVSWSLALVGGALALTFAVGASLDLTLALVLGAGAVALVWCLATGRAPAGRDRWSPARRVGGLVSLAGLALGGAIWFVQGAVVRDALFHLGRVRKLDVFGSLSLHAVDEFKNGGLHPGYAFPLWHAWLALVARLAAVDPTAVVSHESSILVPLALLLGLEMGTAIFGSVWLGLATMLGQVALIALAPGSGGSYPVLWEPGTAARQLLVPTSTALFFWFVRRPSWRLGATLAASAACLALVHPTYALFLALPLAGFVVARALLARGADLRAGVIGLTAFAAPTALVFVWLLPVVRQTLSVDPGPQELARALRAYATDLVVDSTASYHLAPAFVARAGPVAVAALAFTPLAVMGRRRRWGALVLGATVLVLGLELWSPAFTRFANAVSLSQARRAAGFVPFSVGLAGAASLLALLSPAIALPVALGAGVALELAYPGDFGVHVVNHGPGIVAWVALVGGLAALLVGTVLAGRRHDPDERLGRGPLAALAAALFVLPVAVHGFSQWHAPTPRDADALSPGLIRFLRDDVPQRSVVFADLETSYRISAFEPVYVVAAPPAHVANTKPNRVEARRQATLRFFDHGADLSIPRRWGAGWLVLRRHEPVRAVEAKGLRPVYRDDRYVVFRL